MMVLGSKLWSQESLTALCFGSVAAHTCGGQVDMCEAGAPAGLPADHAGALRRRYSSKHGSAAMLVVLPLPLPATRAAPACKSRCPCHAGRAAPATLVVLPLPAICAAPACN